MPKNRPHWGKHTRNLVRVSQDNKCAWCGEELQKQYEVHHDFKGHKWADIKKVLGSDDMKALGLSGDAKLEKWMFKDSRSLFAMHPKCHIEADKAQAEGKLIMEQVRKA